MTLKQVSLVILIITSQYLKNVLNQKQIILFQNYYYFLLILNFLKVRGLSSFFSKR